jgi:hypothetical protein
MDRARAGRLAKVVRSIACHLAFRRDFDHTPARRRAILPIARAVRMNMAVK